MDDHHTSGYSGSEAASVSHELLLRAAADIFAVAGWRGATTRRIVEAAGVNEVTAFRHFGSKEVLIMEAVRRATEWELRTRLPMTPKSPEVELTAWSMELHGALRAAGPLIRAGLAESEEHPDICRYVCRAPVRASRELQEYIERLLVFCTGTDDGDEGGAAALLVGALLWDAMLRDVAPESLLSSPRDAVRHHVRLLLRAVGCAM